VFELFGGSNVGYLLAAAIEFLLAATFNTRRIFAGRSI
jgi:hypothetical protein